MRNVLSVAITLSGWVLAGSYVLYEYKEYGSGYLSHMFAFEDFSSYLFHFFVLTAPIVSAAFGYLVNDRVKLLRGIGDLKARYQDYYDKAPYGYHSADSDVTIVEVNDTWLDMLGYTRGEVVGKMKVSDLLTDDGVKTLNDVYPGFREKGYVENVEYDFRKKDGSLLPVLLSSTAVYGDHGEFIRSRTIVKDITERKAYESVLITVAKEWTDTFDSMPWGIMLLDSEYNILRANRYISELTGVSIKEVVTKKCFDVFHGTDNPIGKCLLQDCKKKQDAVLTEYYEPRFGRHFRLYCTPLKVKGKIKSFVHSFVDISDIKTGEKKLLDSRNAFFNMLTDASASYKDLRELHNSLIVAFANAIDAKSNWTKGHSERVSHYAIALAREIGMKEKNVNLLRVAALLHDVGKIGTYDYLLDKPAKLTKDEFEIVKKHPMKSAEILEPISQLRSVIDIVKYHHERYDGNGYPEGLKGEDVPLMARILCIADSFDSMTADRPYRPAPGLEYAREELSRCAGSHFDPELVQAFQRVLERRF
jgi:PAS domain S-box-containing protein/putative nucleotidyltransferase with HDIG domain